MIMYEFDATFMMYMLWEFWTIWIKWNHHLLSWTLSNRPHWSVPSPVVLQSQNMVKFNREQSCINWWYRRWIAKLLALVLRSLSPVFRAVSVLSGIFLASWLWSVLRCSRPIELRFCVWRCSLFLCLVVRSPVMVKLPGSESVRSLLTARCSLWWSYVSALQSVVFLLVSFDGALWIGVLDDFMDEL